MKRIKRALCLLLAAVLTAALFTACGEPAPTEPATDAPTAAPTLPVTEPVTEAPSDATPDQSDFFDLSAYIKAFDTEASIGEQTLYDADGITVTADSIRYDAITGAVIAVTAQNTTDKDCLIQADTAAVNDAMIDVGFSLAVPAGKTAEGEMTLPYPMLALADIRVIATVEFSLRLMDGASYEVTAVSDPVVITTSAAGTYTPAVDDEGQTAYDAKGVRIVLKGLDNSRVFTDSAVLTVYLENRSDKAVCIQTDVVRVNGYELTSAMTMTLPAGKHAVDTVPFFDMDLEEYAIEEIDAIELSFKILDGSSWKVIAKTGMIAVEL